MINDYYVASELELIVIREMAEAGFDPLNPEDIKEYWKDKLPE